jgi:hypothetical protein
MNDFSIYNKLFFVWMMGIYGNFHGSFLEPSSQKNLNKNNIGKLPCPLYN